jgi:hypothetical protein
MKNRIGGACWYIVGSSPGVKSKPMELVFAVSPSRTQLYGLTKGKDGLGLNQDNVERHAYLRTVVSVS